MNFVKDSCKTVFFTLIEMKRDNLEASTVYAKLIKIHDEFKNNFRNFRMLLILANQNLKNICFNMVCHQYSYSNRYGF
jgi:hypothetical protein